MVRMRARGPTNLGIRVRRAGRQSPHGCPARAGRGTRRWRLSVVFRTWRGEDPPRFPDPSRPTVVPDPTTLSPRDREHVGGVVFVVAARAEQPGPPAPVVAGRPEWVDARTDPVGTQHAAAYHAD